jgi:cephalosporin hydroxylase
MTRLALALLAVTLVAGSSFWLGSTLAWGLSNDELTRRFIIRYYDHNNWNQMSWLGVKTLQNPPDMWVLQELLTELRPDYIIEAGTYSGGSALYLATVLEALGLPDSKVLTIDVEPHVEVAEKHPLWAKRVELFVSSSTDPELVKRLGERVAGKTVLVMLDSLHTRAHVAQELELYGPMVSPRSYLVVQDTNINGHPVLPEHGEGPWEAVHEFLPRHPEFEIDKSREKFLVTFTPDGYLKKKRSP